jgi:hypothetical protein
MDVPRVESLHHESCGLQSIGDVQTVQPHVVMLSPAPQAVLSRCHGAILIRRPAPDRYLHHGLTPWTKDSEHLTDRGGIVQDVLKHV